MEFKAYYNSPIGTIEIISDDIYLKKISFIDNDIDLIHNPNNITDKAVLQLNEYFSKKRTSFDIDLLPEGTLFQKQIWNELLKIPYGKTCSYIDIAKLIGDIKLTRAIGNANSKNKIAIIIPCHRVIGNERSLVGYAGGLVRKKWLLDFEKPTKQAEINF